MFGGRRLSAHDLLEFKRGIAECSSFKRFKTGIWVYWIVLQVLKKKEKIQELLGGKRLRSDRLKSSKKLS